MWSSWTLAKCVKFLHENDILSAPVMNDEQPPLDRLPAEARPMVDRCLGIIDMIDCKREPGRSTLPQHIQSVLACPRGRFPLCRSGAAPVVLALAGAVETAEKRSVGGELASNDLTPPNRLRGSVTSLFVWLH